MKKLLLAFVLAASLASALPAAAQEKPVDLIVLLDASQSMFPYFTEVVDFVVSRIAREYLRFGDTFHLLTFTDSVRIEIAQSVRTEQDLKSLLGRLYLLYPFGRSTDLVSALTSLYRYTADLPESSRKLIVMVTDGMHNPSAQSPNAALGTDQVRASIEDTTARIRANGWTIRIVRIPFEGTPGAAGTAGTGSGAAGTGGTGTSEAPGVSPGAGDYLSEVATGLGAPVTEFSSEGREDAAGRSVEMPRVAFPGHLGRQGYDFSFPLVISNPSDRDIRLQLSGVQIRGGNVLRKTLFADVPKGAERTVQVPVRLPDSVEPGTVSLEAELRFADGVRVAPTVGILSLDLERRPLARIFRSTGTAVLFLVLLGAALALIVILAAYIRGLHRRAEQPVVAAVLDSEAAAAEERRRALASATREKPSFVTQAEARTYASDLVPKHVTAEEARVFQEEAVPKHVTREEARIFEASLRPQHVTEEEARTFKPARKDLTRDEAQAYAAGRALTEEEASRYRDTSARDAADTLAAFAAASSPNRPAPASPGGPAEFTPAVKRTGSLRLEFRVEDQNPNIGLRNVRTLQSGGKKSIGGKRSDFLVFLVPVPPRIAEVYFDGEDLTVVPLRPEFFPDYTGPIVDCLGKPVRMVNRFGKVLTLTFDRYVPPADRLNKILRCLETPGLPALNGDDTAGSGAV
jgi:hypothetical protein